MPRHRLYIGIAGLLLLLASVALLTVASNTQMREIDYGVAVYSPAGDWPQYPRGSLTVLQVLILVSIAAIVPLLWLIFGGTMQMWEAGETRPLWQRRRLILLVAIVLLAGLIATFLCLFSERPSQTAQYGQPPTLGQPSGYIAFAELSGPTQVRFGDSTEIAFTMWISEGIVSAPSSNLVLAPNVTYTATAHLQAVNFDLDEPSRTAQSNQSLSVGKSAFWSWVVSPKEKRLGRQTLVVRANVEDAEGNRFGDDPYLKAEVSVTDPIGLPGAVYYILIAVGSVVSLPLWVGLSKDWYERRKERQDEKIKELEKEVRELKARKWWQFWKW